MDESIAQNQLVKEQREQYRTECANESETFDLDKIISHIVKNLSVEKAEEKKP